MQPPSGAPEYRQGRLACEEQPDARLRRKWRGGYVVGHIHCLDRLLCRRTPPSSIKEVRLAVRIELHCWKTTLPRPSRSLWETWTSPQWSRKVVDRSRCFSGSAVKRPAPQINHLPMEYMQGLASRRLTTLVRKDAQSKFLISGRVQRNPLRFYFRSR